PGVAARRVRWGRSDRGLPPGARRRRQRSPGHDSVHRPHRRRRVPRRRAARAHHTEGPEPAGETPGRRASDRGRRTGVLGAARQAPALRRRDRRARAGLGFHSGSNSVRVAAVAYAHAATIRGWTRYTWSSATKIVACAPVAGSTYLSW